MPGQMVEEIADWGDVALRLNRCAAAMHDIQINHDTFEVGLLAYRPYIAADGRDLLLVRCALLPSLDLPGRTS